MEEPRPQDTDEIGRARDEEPTAKHEIDDDDVDEFDEEDDDESVTGEE